VDDKVRGVIDLYHQRMIDEREQRGVVIGGNAGREWRDQVLLAVGPETGALINIVAKSLDRPTIVEIGTSYGYSTIWLAEAAHAAGGRVITMELADYKADYARDMATRAGLADLIDFQVGDALDLIAALPAGIDFVLLDLWKDLYVPCLEAFFPKLNPGAVIVADNMIRPGGESVERYGHAVRAKPGVTSVLLPVGTGIEVSRLAG
jgi:predicted O-methyltransferase YrrM